MSHNHDIVILGSGSTAFAAALRAEALGARALMIEKSMLGGTCINWGCVPSKTLIHAAQVHREAVRGTGIGLGDMPGSIDSPLLMAHKENVVRQLRQTRYLDILDNVPGLTLLKGSGRFLDHRTVLVDDRIIRGERFLIATGGTPRIINFPGLDGVDYLTSRSALLLKQLPESLIIIGGGVIALELGQMFLRLGTRVTVLEHGAGILPTFPGEPAMALQQALIAEGMEIMLRVTICSVRQESGRTLVSAEIDGEVRELAAERLLLAVGTAPATVGIGLEKAGVALDTRGFIAVDERMRTSAGGIWAAGDVTGGTMIATVGAREGIVAVEDMLKPDCGCRMDYLAAPMTIFTDPELGTVGYSEEGARTAGFQTITSSLPVTAIPKAHITGSTAGIITMVADKTTDRLLGVHLACRNGAELINEAALAIHLRATIKDLASALHVYPSMGEGLRLCAQSFTRDVSRLSCCAE